MPKDGKVMPLGMVMPAIGIVTFSDGIVIPSDENL
jgi:hypothetical protein